MIGAESFLDVLERGIAFAGHYFDVTEQPRYGLRSDLVIKLAHFVRATLAVRATVHATRGGVSRSVFGEEYSSFAYGIYSFAGLAGVIIDKVEVVAAFGENGRTGFFFSAPVPAHVAVREMPVTDVFGLVYIGYFADGARIDDFFDAVVIGRVAQYVAYHHFKTFVSRGFLQFHALFEEGRYWLLAKEMIAEFHTRHGVTVMVAVLRGYNQRVGEFARRKKIFFV